MPIATGMGDRRIPGPIDVALELFANGTRSATTNGTAVALEAHKVEFEVFAYGSYSGYVVGTAEWTLGLQASSDGGSSWTTVQTVPVPSGDTPRLVTNGNEIRSALRNQQAKVTHVRGVLTKVGSPGDFTGGAYISLETIE